MATPHDPQILRLRTVEFLPPNATVNAAEALTAKRRGIDSWVHEIPWTNDAGRVPAIERARKAARADFPWALCIRLSQGSAAPTTQRLKDVMDAISDANYLSLHGRPVLYIRDDQESADTLAFVQPLRQAARTLGVREPMICRVINAGELEGVRHLPGIDGMIEIMASCTCKASRGAHNTVANSAATRCLVATDPEAHRRAVIEAVTTQIDDAVATNSDVTYLYVHACNGWSEDLRNAHNAGLYEGMEYMPSYPRAAAPYAAPEIRSQTTWAHRADMSVVLVAQSDPEATMVCLQSALDTSSELGELEFIIVDNGTTDDTRGLIEALGENVRSIRNDSPRTTKEAWTQGLAMTTGDLVLMISNDVMLGIGWYEPLLRALASDRSCNAVSPAIAVANNHMPTQPPAINSGVCLLARGDAARRDTIGDARFIDESVVFLRVEAPERSL